MSSVLIVDDEPSICWGLSELLGEDGHEATAVSSAEAALDLPQDSDPDVVLLDVRLPGQDGISAIPQLRKKFGEIPIVVVTAFGDLSTAVRAVEAGAADYLCKPLNADDVSAVVRKALLNAVPRSAEPATPIPVSNGSDLVGASPAMQKVFKQIALAAATDVPVLVIGESGTGKELISRAIHRHSARRGKSFIPVSLPALNSSLIESELFGHEKGAFTGADGERKGLLEAAAGGTVFLDEVGDTPLDMQVKMLRAIEYHEVTPVGGARTRQVDFRIVAATNRPLTELVQEGRFREDLFYRLHVFVIEAPPLRDRRDDIPLLADHFLHRLGGRVQRMTDEAREELLHRPWHGNVRELRNAVEHAAVVARGGIIDVDHLPSANEAFATKSGGGSLNEQIRNWVMRSFSEAHEGAEGGKSLHDRFLAEVEKPLMEAVLRLCDDNQTTAATMLGIHRSTLRQKLRDLGLR
jgi:two-component system nitrogen regulation response regulator GlnG